MTRRTSRLPSQGSEEDFQGSSEVHPQPVEVNSEIRIAKAISSVAGAPVLAIPAFGAIILLPLGFTVPGVIDFALAILFGSVVPMASALLFPATRTGAFDSRDERSRPLLFSAFGYLVGSAILAILSAPLYATLLMFCYGTNTLAVFLINLSWKISIHAMGVAGPTTALLYAIGIAGVPFGLILLPVAWSRLYLRKHTATQVTAGGLLGFALTTIQFYLLAVAQFHVKPNVDFVVFAAAALMIPFVVLVYLFAVVRPVRASFD